MYGQRLADGTEISQSAFRALSEKGEDVFSKKNKLTLSTAIDEIAEIKAILNHEDKGDGEPWSREWDVVFKESLVLENMARNVSTHACGMVIGQEPLVEYVPLYKGNSKTNDVIATQYTMDLIEDCGLVKMDFLGLITLTIIKNCIRLIRKTAPDFKESDIPDDDSDTFRMLSDGKSSCVFQFESAGMQKILREAKPASIEDMIALNALYRPGPLDWIPVYIAYKNKEQPVFDKPQKAESFRRLEELCRRCKELNDILKPTNMIPIYQEQIMKIGQAVAGFSLGKADLMRRAMGKKKIDVLLQMKQDFINGAVATAGITAADAEFLFEDIIKPFSGYGFNKSHAAAYSVVAYKTAYLKCHFPAEFMAANLTNEIGGSKEKMQEYLTETRSMGIDILPPDINISEKYFTVNNGKIVYGISGIGGVGDAVTDHIQKIRSDKGKFTDFIDFLEKVDLHICNSRVIAALIYSGAFDSIESRPRAELIANLEKMSLYAARQKEAFAGGQASLFEELEKEMPLPKPEYTPTAEWSEKQLLEYEKEYLGFYASHHPLEKYRALWERGTDFRTVNIDGYIQGRNCTVLGMVGQKQKRRTQKGDDMITFTIEDFDGSINAVVFPRTYKASAEQWDAVENDDIIMFTAKFDRQERGAQLIFDRFLEIDLNKIPDKAPASEVHIRFHPRYTQDNLMDLRRMMMNRAGGNRIYLHVPASDGEYILKAPASMGVSDSRDFLEEIGNRDYVHSVWKV